MNAARSRDWGVLIADASRPRGGACLLAALALLAAACSAPPRAGAPDPEAPEAIPLETAAPSSAIREEFERYAEWLERGSGHNFGRGPLEEMKRQVVSSPPGRQRLGAHMRLALFYLREGETDAAIEHIELARPMITAIAPQMPDPRLALAEYHAIRAMTFMRRAEEENCITRHGPGACILPIRDGAVHSVVEPGQEAMRCWQEVVTQTPSDLRARWLANVMAMTLGLHPDGVPEDMRLDFEANQARVPHLGEFLDVATQAGIADLDRAGGVAIEDFDGDGLLDWISSTCDPRGALKYRRNLGDGRFEDATAKAGLADQLGGLNMISADHDADGDPDVLVLRGGWLGEEGVIRMSLLRNDGGRFTDITHAAGLEAPMPTQAAVWADFDGDSDLDLFVADEVKRMGHPEEGSYPCRLYRNDGARFTDIAPVAGVTNNLQAKGVTAGDYDNDGDMDIYVSNIGTNRLYRNDGEMRFTDVAPTAGVTEPSLRSFAPFFFDYDNDGWLDLWVGAYDSKPEDLAADLLGASRASRAPCLYRNQGDGTFKDVARAAGLDHPYAPMGANFGDIDYDGWLDIYLGTGDPHYTSLMPNVMLWNDGGRGFKDVTSATRLGHLQKGHGIGFVDIDGDGDQDIAHQLGGFYRGDPFHNALFVNTIEKPGRFLWLSFVGRGANRDAIGARIEVEVETKRGPRSIHRAQGSVSSFGGSSMRRMEIGLGDATAIRVVRVRWPDGVVQEIAGAALDSHVEIREAEADWRAIPIRRTPLAIPGH